ncbi:TPA: hypothetical protein ACKQAN_003038 [Serratia marcescens]|uniref:hypothetical protein n=1 Tax=Serratia TaxID=613 RepID=UPI0002AF3CF5|nr:MULTISPECIES: hypothetical protein [Serratia]AGE16141.1 hypothetical protein SMWW4_v1c03340 [Serratia marcescens WW4]QPJ89710.1 hypothetical protein HS042_15925 [Serratia marcescens]BEO78596.1 hypothetical protein SMTE4_45660 [Serratia marcescens]HAT3734732.1 hypothetical protein [Serratia marcescens]HEI9794611.1 hypothetical protein [Serratia marcescens]
MMRRKIALLGCTLLMCSQLAQAKLVIEGGLNGNIGSGNGASVDVSINGSTNGNNGNNGTGVNVGGSQKPDSSASQLQKDIYASICASPFMKKYASICQ